MHNQLFVRRQRQRSSDHIVAVYCIMALVMAAAALILLYDAFGFGLDLETSRVSGFWLAFSGLTNLVLSYIWTSAFGTRW